MDSVEALAERLRSNPADREAYQSLRALYRSHGDYGSLANLVAGWAAWVGDDHAAAAAYVEVGDVLAQQLGDAAQAEGFYLEALRRDPLCVAGFDALDALLENQGDFDDEVLSALHEISDVARMCLLLRVVQQLSYEDIAQTIQIPAGTAMSHVHRAKRSIRERLKDRGKESSKYCGHEGNVR